MTSNSTSIRRKRAYLTTTYYSVFSSSLHYNSVQTQRNKLFVVPILQFYAIPSNGIGDTQVIQNNKNPSNLTVQWTLALLWFTYLILLFSDFYLFITRVLRYDYFITIALHHAMDLVQFLFCDDDDDYTVMLRWMRCG